jgi:hypothetical protein
LIEHLKRAREGGRVHGAWYLHLANDTQTGMKGVIRDSQPFFYDNFSDEDGITDPDLAKQLAEAVAKLSEWSGPRNGSNQVKSS